jgi:VWFA-related protein
MNNVWAKRLGLTLTIGLGAGAFLWVRAQAQPPAIPDAPTPQLPTAGVTPGAGTSSSSATGGDAATPSVNLPAATPAAAPAPAATPALNQETPVSIDTDTPIIRTGVYEVNIAFTVKDAKGKLVPGIRQPEIQVFENGRPMIIRRFVDEADVQPLSVAIVIDQSMNHNEMDTVNTALGALQGAFSKYDEVSIFTYNKSPRQVTEFTGAQSPRASQAIEVSKASGRDQLLAGSLDGPMAQTITLNNQQFDPNTAPVRGQNGMILNAPKEVHPLYDAILQAATALTTRPTDFRRVIYVISNGNEYGSKTTGKQLLKYLQTNGIEVDGSLVGIETALPVVGMLDRIHLPLEMRDNVLSPLAAATGGNVDAEFRASALEHGFAKVVGEARDRYIVTWDSPEPFSDGKSRSLNITILRPGLTVIAPPLYYPESQERRQRKVNTIPTPGTGPEWQQGRPE